MGRGGSKKCKPIPAPPRGVGLKSCPIPAPSPLQGGKNPHGTKRGRAGQAGRGGAKLPSLFGGGAETPKSVEWDHSMAGVIRRVWKLVWTLNTSPKVRNFLWRACSNILPTRDNCIGNNCKWSLSVQSAISIEKRCVIYCESSF